MEIRGAFVSETEALAKLWYNGWNDAHSNLVPEAFAKLRTFEDFTQRLGRVLDNVRVVGAKDDPLGFHIVKLDELNQLYVREDARGKGVAQELISDAESKILSQGFEIAWLACGIGNNRAAKFYQKCGWKMARKFLYEAETSEGIFKFDVWRYEKQLKGKEPFKL